MRFLLVFFLILAGAQAHAKPNVTFPKAIYYPLNGEDEMTELVFSYGLKVEREKKLMLEQSYVVLDVPPVVLKTLGSKTGRKEWLSYIEKQTANWLPHNGPTYKHGDGMVANATIDRVYMYFTTQLIINLAEARRLIVEIAEGLVSELNANDHFATCYSRDHTFTASNLIIKIDFETYFGKYVDPLRIGSILLEGGVTHFWAWNGKKYYGDCWEYRNEPYYKSRQYVMIERQSEAAQYFQMLGEVNSVAPGTFVGGGSPYSVVAPQYGQGMGQSPAFNSSPGTRGYLGSATSLDKNSESIVQTNYKPLQSSSMMGGMAQSNYSAPVNTLGRQAPSMGPAMASQGAYQANMGGMNMGNVGMPLAGGCNIPSLAAGQMMPQGEMPYPGQNGMAQAPQQGPRQGQIPNYGPQGMSSAPQPGQMVYQDNRQNNMPCVQMMPQTEIPYPPLTGMTAGPLPTGYSDCQFAPMPSAVPPPTIVGSVRGACMEPPEGFVSYATPPGENIQFEGEVYGRPGDVYPGFLGNYPNPTWAPTVVTPYYDKKFSDGWIFMNPDPSLPASPLTPTEAPQMTPSYMFR